MATATLPTTRITPEQFLELPDRERYELIHGELVEMPVMSMESSAVAARFIVLLGDFLRTNDLGVVMGSDATYQCFPHDPDLVRRPDVSFLSAARLSVDQYQFGHCRIPPDLAVEVLSPNDVMYDVEEKIAQFLSAGVQLVWFISPKSRTLTVYRPHVKPEHFEFDESVDGGTILPGFQFRVSDVFPKIKGVS